MTSPVTTSITYPGGSNQATYTYDAANRLTAVTGWDSNVIQYAYDDANRMTSATLPSGTGIVSAYTYDDGDRLTQVQPPSPASAISYDWDDNGNLTDRGSDTFEWDYEDRMVEATPGREASRRQPTEHVLKTPLRHASGRVYETLFNDHLDGHATNGTRCSRRRQRSLEWIPGSARSKSLA